MFPERFWVSLIYKGNFIYKKRGKVAKENSLGERDQIIKLVKKIEEV